MLEKIKEAADYIKSKVDLKPEIGLILGSGLGVLADEVKDSVQIPYSKIPNFPESTVEGHAGQLVIGLLEGKPVIAMQGRFHYYEGYSMQEITLPVRVMKLLGINKLLVTNAAGGVNRNFNPGDLMIITDHINLMGSNPLIGKNIAEFGTRFPDMSEPYNKGLIKLAEEIGKSNGIITRKGVYAAMSGPNYETPFEIRFLANNGVDAVGMSTVPEVIVANHMNIDVLGISLITNMAAGILAKPLSHSEVVDTAERVKPEFIKLVRGILKNI